MNVLLAGVPAELHLRNLGHIEDLLHELRIVRAGDTSGQTEAGPRLAGLMGDILDTYMPARDASRDQAEAAVSSGSDVVDIELDLPVEASEALRRLVDMLDEADDLCRQLALLTLAAPRSVRELRHWMASEISGQLVDGRPPTPFPG